MFSRFFIDRPIFAAVLAIFIVIAGLSATRTLPIAQYPEIAPPVVTVVAVYPGASAEVIEQTVAAPLENAINGVEDMIYMGSTSTSNGIVTIQVTFDIGTNADQAAQLVNNRVKQAENKLPLEVRRLGAHALKLERGDGPGRGRAEPACDVAAPSRSAGCGRPSGDGRAARGSPRPARAARS